MDPKQLALEHFEKALLAVAVGVLVFIGIGMAKPPKELGANVAAQGAIERVAKFWDEAKAPPALRPDWVKQAEGQLAPEQVPEPVTFPGWVMHRRPTVLADVEQAKAAPDVVHEAPMDVEAKADERGKVIVSWKPSSKNLRIVIMGYEVERREGEQGEWKLLTKEKLERDKASYEDTDLQSRKKYWYRVASTAEVDKEEEAFKKFGVTLASDRQRLTSDEAGPVVTQRDSYVLPSLGSGRMSQRVALALHQKGVIKEMPDMSKLPEKGGADLIVYKWDRVENGFVKKAYRGVAEDASIGALEKRFVPPGKSSKDAREVDFRTGAKLKQVAVRKRMGPQGYEQEITEVTIVWSDGTEETVNDRDVPPELKGK